MEARDEKYYQSWEVLQCFNRQLYEARESERLRLARQLHDEIIQPTLLLHQKLYGLHHNTWEAHLNNTLIKATELTQELLTRLRDIVYELRPPMLDFGLITALQDFIAEVSEINPQFRFDFTFTGDQSLLLQLLTNRTTELNLYRFVQEAITNAIKHSRAHTISTSVVMNLISIAGSDSWQLEITVADDGGGISEQLDYYALAKEKHFGLLGMRERIEELEGSFELISNAKNGTLIRARLKLG